MNGLLIINKPLTYSSMDIIRILRRLTGIKKIGHAGTLDPLATGVLLVCIGKATKKIESLMDTNKEYIAELNLNAFSETDDAEGKLTLVEAIKIPTLQDITEVIKNFIGDISQIPPKYSAIKIQGQPAYKKVLRGETFEIQPRIIKIYNIEILSYNWPILKIKVNCGRGTYIRTLARDIGNKLNTGGYLTGLIRTAVGDYTIDKSIDFNMLCLIKESDIISLD
ncbi:MAG: tRNA pseudouridine(55) synthase TruB [Candidatus Babeliales bacterium]|nr:tRNA pseudouridine(55) synthase TruB [Candidatus Babeliales bacterium]